MLAVLQTGSANLGGNCDYNGFFSRGTSLKQPPTRLFIHIGLAACFVLGLANAIGWVFDLPVLLSLFARLPKMVPATSLLVLASASSLWLQVQRPADARMAGMLGIFVCCLASFMLACHLIGVAPPPFVLSRPGAQSAVSFSSPITAAMFSGLGISLAGLARERHVTLAQLAAMAVLLLSVLNLAGYFFEETLLYQVLPGKGVSLPTTAAAILLASVALLLRPSQGIMTVIAGASPSARIARRLLVSALAVPVLLAACAVAALDSGLSDAATLLPLLAWGTIVLLALLIWRFAVRLYEIDVARTRAEQELQGALQQLRDERDRKDVFLATLAHELRNPLAPIQSAAEVLHHMRDPDKVRLDKVSSMILRQVDNMVNLVDDLMDVSRIGRGQLVLDFAPVDVRMAITDAVEQVRPAIERKGHVCRLDLLPEPAMVLGEHKRLVQVIANLLANAVKYTPEGGVLAVELKADAREVKIAVRDNGAGIDAALLPKVFETFTQAALTPDRREGGLGLGLALVKRLTELHGGRVFAESAGAGAGSTFWVLLPHQQVQHAAPGHAGLSPHLR